ncbi:MAG: tetratricopeptide repeat protein [Thalassospira sp.]|uniref:tetratricopeptide repeat protein n=1 Tax=Thalassospira sp. TaxID=1912094 RepID=UPI0032EAC264
MTHKGTGGSMNTDSTKTAEELFELATIAQKTGRLEDAKALYKSVLGKDPKHVDALHYLGLCLRQQNALSDAAGYIQRSLEINPNNPSAQNSLGATLCSLNRFDEAEIHFQAAIKQKPDNVEAYRNLGLICFNRQKFSEAIGYFQTALSHAPKHVEVLKSYGNALLHMDQPDKALLIFEKALSINARDANLQTDTGIAFQFQNRFREAMEFNSLAICIEPGENRHWAAFCACINGLLPTPAGHVEDKLEIIMAKGDHAPHDLMMPIAGTLFHKPAFREIIGRYARHVTAETIPVATISKDISQLVQMPLLLRLLSNYPVTNILIEKVLTTLRQHILLSSIPIDEIKLPFVCALALQCFNTEYTYLVSQEEETQLGKLKQHLRDQINEGHSVDPAKLALLGCYEPLFKVFEANDFLDSAFSSDMEKVLTRQVREPCEEQSIRNSIPDWTGSSNDVSKAVRSQYEENPYPRWIHTTTVTNPRSVSECLQSAPLNMNLADYKAPASPEILVAGCGTGQHALQPATRFSNARVTAIDLSTSSLAYAQRQSKKLGVTDIEFGRADILELSALNRSFDVVECVGVLHHLEDPMAGWQVLTKLLRPGGLMKIGLYSELARKDVVAGRQIVKEQGFSATTDDMRKCRQFVIAEATKGNPDLQQLSRRSDFFSLSAFRDLIFHVQEHRFSLPMVQQHLEKQQLEFLDFEMAFAGDLIRFRDSISDRPSNEKLLLWHDYETQRPDTFRGMYQFWCRKPAN